MMTHIMHWFKQAEQKSILYRLISIISTAEVGFDITLDLK